MPLRFELIDILGSDYSDARVSNIVLDDIPDADGTRYGDTFNVADDIKNLSLGDICLCLAGDSDSPGETSAHADRGSDYPCRIGHFFFSIRGAAGTGVPGDGENFASLHLHLQLAAQRAVDAG